MQKIREKKQKKGNDPGLPAMADPRVAGERKESRAKT